MPTMGRAARKTHQSTCVGPICSTKDCDDDGNCSETTTMNGLAKFEPEGRIGKEVMGVT